MTERILIIIEGQDKGANAALGKLQQNLTGADQAAGKAASGGISSLFSKLAGTGILLAAGQAALQFGKDSLKAASDAEEAGSKFDTVFREQGPAVRAELDAFADAAKRSGVEMQGMAANIQDTLVPMGIAREEAAGLSVDVVKLAADLGSFNNMPMDEALQRLQGTLVGSHENALAFGVVINENTLKAELAANGWDTLTGKQLEAAKVQARLNLLYAGTTDAQGDAIRTSDSYANSQAGLEASVLDLQVALGGLATEGLAEVNAGAMTLVNNLTDLVSWIGKIKNLTDEHTQAVALSSVAYDEYAAEVVRTAVVTGKLNEKQAQIVLATFKNADANTELSGTMKQVAADIGLLTNAERVQLQQTESLTRAYEAAGVTAYVWSESQQKSSDITVEWADNTFYAAQAIALQADNTYLAYINSEKFADRLALVNERSAELTEAMQNAKPPVDELMNSLNQDISNSLGQFIDDLQWFIASGGKDFAAEFQKIKEVLAEKIAAEDTTPGQAAVAAQQAREDAAKLYAEIENLKVSMGEKTEFEAATSLAETLGITLDQAKLLLEDFDTYADEVFGSERSVVVNSASIDDLHNKLIAAEGDIYSLGDAANAVKGTYDIHFNITQSGSIPSVNGTQGAPTNKPGSSQEMATGGIVPGVFSQPVPMVVHGSEMILNPQQQANLFALLNGGGAGMGSRELAPIVQVYLDSEPIAARVITKVNERGRLNATSGMASAGR